MQNLFVRKLTTNTAVLLLRLTDRWWFRLIFGRSPKRTVARIAVLVTTTFLIFHFVLAPIRVWGISMDPTYPDGTVHLVNKLAYVNHEPQRGDVIAVLYSRSHLLLLKRIIGLPGERIRIRQGKVLVNSHPLQEPYLKHRPAKWNCLEIHLGPDEFFIVGDNRGMDQEYHTFGPFERRNILGKLIY